MIPANQKPRTGANWREAPIDDARAADIKAGRKFTKDRRELEASLYSSKLVYWDQGEKPAAMEDWSKKVMAVDLSRKAVKTAWALSYVFNSLDGGCYEKKSKLAERAGLSEQALKDGLTELEKMSLIIRRKEMRNGKMLTVIYPAEPVLKVSSQSRLDAPEPTSLSRQGGSSLSRQGRLHSQDPCIRDLSERRSLNPYSENTEHYIGDRWLPEDRDSESIPEHKQVDDSDIPF